MTKEEMTRGELKQLVDDNSGGGVSWVDYTAVSSRLTPEPWNGKPGDGLLKIRKFCSKKFLEVCIIKGRAMYYGLYNSNTATQCTCIHYPVDQLQHSLILQREFIHFCIRISTCVADTIFCLSTYIDFQRSLILQREFLYKNFNLWS